GPFDILLFFIERDELDIYNIPIAQITEDFLSYLEEMERLNVEVASEFILVASTLMRIKAKMLLPRPSLDEEGNEIDPRDELVKHLLEYKKYKSVLKILSEMEIARAQQEKRGNLKKELASLATTINVESELQDLDLYKMMRVFQKVMSKHDLEKSKPTHTIVQYPYTIEKQKERLMSRLPYGKKLSFSEMVDEKPEKILVIFNFLSILELLQLKMIVLSIGEGFNNFWIERI
ncbi:MAG: segregation/condensation protein A, partial [Bacteroidota bacterium]